MSETITQQQLQIGAQEEIGEIGVVAYPADFPVVEADDAGVGGGADAEIDFAVGADGEVGDGIFSLCGKVGDDSAVMALVIKGGDGSHAMAIAMG